MRPNCTLAGFAEFARTTPRPNLAAPLRPTLAGFAEFTRTTQRPNLAAPLRASLAGFAVLALIANGLALADDDVLTLHYPASDEKDKLSVDVTYYLWLPPDAEIIRGVIVHQHGCGEGAETAGQTAAHDLHWRALAAKHNCALLGSCYRGGDDCKRWYEPGNGSDDAFRVALYDLGEKSDHPELPYVPWCLWGHSGGAVWAYRMLERYPERTVALFLRSGKPTKFSGSEAGTVRLPTGAMPTVPIVCCIGAKEKDDERFQSTYKANVAFFADWRTSGSPISFAPDPMTGHECGNSRYLAIPFFDACLRLRLPARIADPLKSVDRLGGGWLGDNKTHTICPATEYRDEPVLASWFPDEASAVAWRKLVSTGQVEDESPPEEAPRVSAIAVMHDMVQLNWQATPDFQSGIRQFAIYRDGEKVGESPEKPKGGLAIPQNHAISYHDTPENPWYELQFVDSDLKPDTKYTYTVVTVNGYGLPSPHSAPVEVRTARIVESETPEYAPIVINSAIDANRRKLVESAADSELRFRYDVFLPAADDERAPAAIVLKTSGGRMEVVLAEELSNRGFVAVVVPIEKDEIYPDAVVAVRNAVRWLRKNSDQYQVASDRIALVAPHDLGVWAAHAALTRDLRLFEQLEGDEKVSGNANGVVLLNSPLTPVGILVGDSHGSRGLSIDFIDKNPYWPRTRSREVFFPATRISKDVPPVLFLYNPDLAIRPDVIEFRRHLIQAKVRNELVIMPHLAVAFWWREPWFSATIDEIDGFCKSLDKKD